MSVKVGVRVRPFNKRQQQLDCKCCIEMSGNTTQLLSLDGGAPKTFVFDYSFWSHDRFKVNQKGINIPIDDKYADQKKVYNQIGTQILVNAWQGYNCCLFAYGQTGSGKSYSMLGYGPNRGIIPMVCDNIFEKISNDQDKNRSYQVKVSMMEIYNQSLRDLLSKAKKNQQDLKICQSKKLGVYVQGLVKHPVHSYEQIDKKIEQGSNNRSIAATLMNESSSRSHTIVSITFLQKTQVTNKQASVKYSTIHLVDLAGSQSVGKTGADSKDRLRQAAKINQSLTTLGRVIQILAQNASRTQKLFVPYRDSKLTFILRNALGGNSKTAMICAISPADDNYEQTLSTLRYANRAKKIQNKAIVNQSDVDKLIRTLKQQNEMLKKMLLQAKNNKTSVNTQMISNFKQMNRNLAEFGLLPEDELILDDNSSVISKDDKDTSFSQSSILDYNQRVDEKEPYITNLSQDQLLSGRLKYSCERVLTIGNKHGNPRPDVVLSALGILPLHCKIVNKQGNIFIQVCDEQASQYTFVNGQNVAFGNSIQLMNFDRLIFGTGCVFLVKIPQGVIRQTKNDKQLKPQDIDHTFAITQLQQHHTEVGLDKNMKANQAQQEQIRKKVLTQIQSEYQKMKQQGEQELKKRLMDQQKQYQQKIKQIQKIRSQEAKRLKQQLQKQASEASKLKNDKQKIQQEIVHFQNLQKKLQQSKIDKAALLEAQKALQQKMKTINNLQSSLLQIEAKQLQMKQEMEKKQIVIQKQLQYKMIMCNNENILNQYKLQLSKKMKNTNQLKDLLIKKERIEMQKQLVQLVPMVEKFNLIAKQMGKQVQCGLSIDYSYISQGQTLQILKNNTYKTKIKISIHVLNKDEKRSYFWSVQAFKNRFEIAMSMFEVYIRNQKDPQLQNRQTDPYWDPPTPQLIGAAFLSLQSIFYRLSYEGDMRIVRKGQNIGKIHVKIYPTDAKKTQNLSQLTMSGITIYNPREFIQKTLFFCIELSDLKLNRQSLYSGIQIQYSLFQNSYKNFNVQSPLLPPQNFTYSNFHTLADLSETIIVQYVQQPISIKFYAEQKQIIDDDDTLTIRDDQSEKSSVKGSFADNRSDVNIEQLVKTPSPVKKSFTSQGNSGIIVSNFDVMSKIEKQYNKQKQQIKKAEKEKQLAKTETKKKSKKDDCIIF